MYYDTYRGKKRGGRRRKSGGCTAWLAGLLFRLIAWIIVLALIAAGGLYALPVGLMNVEGTSDLALTDGLPGSRVNILLLGLDYMEEGQQRSDAMIVASVGYDGVKLISVMRDTMVDIPGHGRHKLNSAYSYGGAEMTMRVINDTFDLNITNYVAVDLRTLVDLIDALGGVDVNIEENEIEQVNLYAWRTYKKLRNLDAQKYLHYADSELINMAGTYHLNGLFATGYTRVRYSDSDYMRTARQREVISGMVKQLRNNFYKPQIYMNLYNVYKTSVDTNLALWEVISIGEKILISGNIETHRVPLNEHLLDDGSTLTITDPEENVRALHDYIYAKNT